MEQIRMDSVWVSVKTCGKSLAMRRSTGCYQYFQGTFSENFLGELMKVSKQWWLWVKPVVAFLHRAFYSTIQQFAVAGGKPLAHWPTSSYCFLITVKVMAVLFQLALLTRIPNNHPLPQDWIRRRKSNATFFFSVSFASDVFCCIFWLWVPWRRRCQRQWPPPAGMEGDSGKVEGIHSFNCIHTILFIRAGVRKQAG